MSGNLPPCPVERIASLHQVHGYTFDHHLDPFRRPFAHAAVRPCLHPSTVATAGHLVA